MQPFFFNLPPHLLYFGIVLDIYISPPFVKSTSIILFCVPAAVIDISLSGSIVWMHHDYWSLSVFSVFFTIMYNVRKSFLYLAFFKIYGTDSLGLYYQKVYILFCLILKSLISVVFFQRLSF